MIRAIGRLVEKCFYPGQLDHPLDDDSFDLSLVQTGLPRNVILLSTSATDGKCETRNGTGFENTAEVALCEKMLRRLLSKADAFARPPSIVILTPYIAQQKLLRRVVDQVVAEYVGATVEVHTVHGFQGREADFAIVSLVRSNPSGEMGFVNDDQLMNVALSRGRAGLVLVGDVAFLSKQPTDSAVGRVVSHIRSNPIDCAILGLRQ
jgi:superfamily I DNA and/or RNA helicase